MSTSELPHVPDWKLAYCVGVDTNLFFAKGEDILTTKHMYCDHCQIQRDCMIYAIQNGLTGLWGEPKRQRNMWAAMLGISQAT